MQAKGAPDPGPPELPDVLETRSEGGSVLLKLRLRPDLTCFEGHFERHPIVPGVVQVAWAVQLAATHLGAEHDVIRLDRIKFTGLLTPEQTPTLVLQFRNPTSVQFEYIQHGDRYASGRLIYEH